MQLLWTLLRALFPKDPVRQCIEAARRRIRHLVETIETNEAQQALSNDPNFRIHLEAILLDYEASLHMAIGARACQIAKLKFKPQHRAFYRPTTPKTVAELMARLDALVLMLCDIERLAQLRAQQLTSERDADPLSLRASGLLRLDAAHRSTSPSFAGGGQCPSSLAEGGGGGSRALARETEGAAREAGGLPRAPPVFDVQLNPQPASQALPARPRAHAQSGYAVFSTNTVPAE